MAHTKEGKARNKSLRDSFKHYEQLLEDDRLQVIKIVSDAMNNGGVNENTIDKLAGIFRGYEYIKPKVEQAWEDYENHCIRFDYDIA